MNRQHLRECDFCGHRKRGVRNRVLRAYRHPSWGYRVSEEATLCLMCWRHLCQNEPHPKTWQAAQDR